MIAEPALTKLQTTVKKEQTAAKATVATQKAKIAAAPASSQKALTAQLQKQVASSNQDHNVESRSSKTNDSQ